MTPIGGFGPRHYTGDKPSGPALWRCPTCRGENSRPMEQGCGHCGAGTAAQVQRQDPLLDDAALGRVILGADAAHVRLDFLLTFEGLTPPARLTLLQAIAAYADGAGVLSADELTRTEVRSWAAYLRAHVDIAALGEAAAAAVAARAEGDPTHE